MLMLRLLGNVAVTEADRSLSGRAVQPRRLALLALLALAPRKTLSRDKLLAFLWPEADTEQGRHLLSVAVYELRKAIGEATIITARDEVALAPEALMIDVDEFTAALTAHDFERAAALYGGPFLDGFHISDAVEFERWADGERMHLARRYAEALEKLAHAKTEQGDAAGAVAAWRRLAAHDPYSARVAVGLMLALEATGDRAGALQHARAHAALLRAEFAAEPDPEVETLAARLRKAPRDQPVKPAHAAVAGNGSDMQAPPPSRRRPGRVVAALMTAIAIGGLFLLVRTRDSAEQSAPPLAAATIAVLPFDNLSPNDSTFFADGLTEDIIGALSRVPGLSVVARSSAFVFRGHVDAREVGQKLNVAYIVEGTVRLIGERLKVTAHLVSTKDGYEVWSDEYDQPFQMADLISIQEDIAQAAVTAVSARLARGSIPKTLVPASTEDVQAFELYVTGRHFFYRRTVPDLMRAIEFFDRALARDSMYALAYAAKGEVLTLLGAFDYGALPPRVAFPQARAAAQRALAINPELAEGHAALASALFNFEWDWHGAEREYRRAIELSPGNATTHHWYSLFLHTRGRQREAFEESMRARELDPLSSVIRTGLARHYYLARDNERAIAEYTGTLAADSTFVTAHVGMGMVYAAEQRYDDAIREYEAAARSLGMTSPLIHALIANAHGRANRKTEALPHIEALKAVAAKRYVPAEYNTLALTGIGDLDAALAHLNQAFANRSAAMIYIPIEPLADPLRADPRLAILLDKLPK